MDLEAEQLKVPERPSLCLLLVKQLRSVPRNTVSFSILGKDEGIINLTNSFLYQGTVYLYAGKKYDVS